MVKQKNCLGLLKWMGECVDYYVKLCVRILCVWLGNSDCSIDTADDAKKQNTAL